jgi:hypothetical protein
MRLQIMKTVTCALVVGVAAVSLPTISAAQARVPIAAGDLPGCLSGSQTDPGWYMRRLHATVLRVVVSQYYGEDGQALPCIRAARRQGYRTELVIQWNSRWALWRTKDFFKHILGEYRLYVWAVAIGNEQEITPKLSSSGYSHAWRALEPIVRRMAPWAIRVGGEISPWGLGFLSGALRDGLPGIQALAVHPYYYSWAFSPGQALRLAHRYGLPLWDDEGLYDGPGTWHPHQARSLRALRGAALIGVWEA